MYQDQNQYSIDYLNQIAPPEKKPGLSRKMTFILAGLGAALVIVIGLALFGAKSAGPTTDMQTLAARLQTLQTIMERSRSTIKSSELRTINSNLSIILTNANRDIALPLKNNNVDVKKLDKNIVTAENGTKLSAALENARLNAVYDETYAREINYQLATVLALMKKLYNETNSKSLKEYLNNTNTNITPLKKQLDSFTTTTT
jgi:hypothetical protein